MEGPDPNRISVPRRSSPGRLRSLGLFGEFKGKVGGRRDVDIHRRIARWTDVVPRDAIPRVGCKEGRRGIGGGDWEGVW